MWSSIKHMSQQNKDVTKHPYNPPKVGDGYGSLKTSEVERQAFALGYYIGRKCWDLEYEHDQTEKQIKEADGLAYWAGYDFGSYHARQAVGKPYPPKRNYDNQKPLLEC